MLNSIKYSQSQKEMLVQGSQLETPHASGELACSVPAAPTPSLPAHSSPLPQSKPREFAEVDSTCLAKVKPQRGRTETLQGERENLGDPRTL